MQLENDYNSPPIHLISRKIKVFQIIVTGQMIFFLKKRTLEKSPAPLGPLGNQDGGVGGSRTQSERSGALVQV